MRTRGLAWTWLAGVLALGCGDDGGGTSSDGSAEDGSSSSGGETGETSGPTGSETGTGNDTTGTGGSSDAGPLDLNADGINDLIVGAPTAELHGGVFVFYGGPNLASVTQASEADVFLRGSQGGSELGSSLDVGDLNGDGIPDLFAAEPSSHRAAVFYGGPSFQSETASDENVDAAFGGYGLGPNLVAVGDVTGDGTADAIIAASEADDGGRVYVFVGGELTSSSHEDADIVFSGDPGIGDAIGSALTVEDVDGDGIDDILVGSMTTAVQGVGAVGTVYGFRGGDLSDSDTGAADWVFPGNPALTLAQFGTAIEVGDFDNDGANDVVVGGPGKDGGLYFFLGDDLGNGPSDHFIGALGIDLCPSGSLPGAGLETFPIGDHDALVVVGAGCKDGMNGSGLTFVLDNILLGDGLLCTAFVTDGLQAPVRGLALLEDAGITGRQLLLGRPGYEDLQDTFESFVVGLDAEVPMPLPLEDVGVCAKEILADVPSVLDISGGEGAGGLGQSIAGID